MLANVRYLATRLAEKERANAPNMTLH
jgi:hypothetical protein